jgi:hypothetical protein
MLACLLAGLGLPGDFDSKDPSYPFAQVALLSSDTPHVMPTTSRELCEFALFQACVWVSCFPHVGNLFLLHELTIPSVAKLLAHAKPKGTDFAFESLSQDLANVRTHLSSFSFKLNFPTRLWRFNAVSLAETANPPPHKSYVVSLSNCALHRCTFMHVSQHGTTMMVYHHIIHPT